MYLFFVYLNYISKLWTDQTSDKLTLGNLLSLIAMEETALIDPS
jgi:hypothetical protein